MNCPMPLDAPLLPIPPEECTAAVLECEGPADPVREAEPGRANGLPPEECAAAMLEREDPADPVRKAKPGRANEPDAPSAVLPAAATRAEAMGKLTEPCCSTWRESSPTFPRESRGTPRPAESLRTTNPCGVRVETARGARLTATRCGPPEGGRGRRGTRKPCLGSTSLGLTTLGGFFSPTQSRLGRHP